MPSERDPRKDPKPGDEIYRHSSRSLSGGIFRKITDVRGEGFFVFFDQDNGYTVRPRKTGIAEWFIWAEKAEVTHAAD